jgi:hypothetical protein
MCVLFFINGWWSVPSIAVSKVYLNPIAPRIGQRSEELIPPDILVIGESSQIDHLLDFEMV